MAVHKIPIPPKLTNRLLAYATVLVAFFLRANRLADKNIWWDEGWSIWLSQKDLAWIALRTAADEHPPLHYWLLHFWNDLAGTSAFAGRFVSLAFGVLTVALIYRIGKQVGSKWLGVLAAFLLAIARFHIWWSQDIKNYTPSIFFVFVAVWCGLNSDWLMANGKWQVPTVKRNRHTLYALCYSLFAALAMWTHYLAALVLIAFNLYALLRFTYYALRFRASWLIGSLAHWLIANLLAAALFAPWLYLYLQNAATWTAAPAFDFGVFLKLVATVLPLGVTTNIDDYAWLTVLFTTLACIPIFSILAKRSVFKKSSLNTEHRTLNTVPLSTVLLFTLIIAFPPLLVYALSLTPASFFAPKIQARYLLILLPAYTILLALGILFLSRLSRAFAAFAFLALLAANLFVLNDYYAERRLTDEYATLANTINSFARQGDLVLFDTDQEWPTFLYYLRAPLDWLGVPNGKPMTDADADALVRRALNRNNAIWLVAIPDALATDPQKMIEARIARALPKQMERTIDNKRLALYAPDVRDWVNIAPENFAPQFPRAEQIDLNAQLIGYDLPAREFYPGDTLRLTTYWRAPYPAQVSLRVQNLLTLPVRIPAGNYVRIENDLALPPDARGDYRLQINTTSLARITIAQRLAIARTSRITNPRDVRFGDTLDFAGFDLPQTKFRAGDSVSLTLYWRAEQRLDTNYTLFAHIVGEQFNPKLNNPLWGQIDRAPRLPMPAWLPGEIVSEAYLIKIDADTPPGNYQIEIGMYDSATGARVPTSAGDSAIIAQIQITP